MRLFEGTRVIQILANRRGTYSKGCLFGGGGEEGGRGANLRFYGILAILWQLAKEIYSRFSCDIQ